MTDNNEEYSLYTEKVAAKPWFRSKKLWLILKTLFLSVFAGTVAGATFVLVATSGYDGINTDNEVYNEVTIPMDDEYENAGDMDDLQPEDAQKASDGQSGAANDTVSLYDYVSSIADEVNPSIVTVTATTIGEDPLFAITSNETNYSGVIIADNGVEYLILTDYAVGASENLKVKFFTDISVKAQFTMNDETTGLAVIAVKHTDIPLSTRTSIKIVDMANSYMLSRGDMVIAIGNLYGINDAIDFGMIVGNSEYAYEADSKHGLIYTNLPCTGTSRGFIFNEKGELAGCISTDLSSDSLVAYAISDIKMRIQNMSNQKNIGYIGIIGRDVTDEMAEQYGMPQGVYVASAQMNSPAYYAGIYNGDIITDIAGRTILNVYNIERAMCEFEPGTQVKVTVYRYTKDGYVPIEYTVTLR